MSTEERNASKDRLIPDQPPYAATNTAIELERLQSSDRRGYTTKEELRPHVHVSSMSFNSTSDTREGRGMPLNTSSHSRKPVWLYSRRLHIFWNNGWLPEILSCGSSLVALVCLIATLRHFEGKITSDMPNNISINTLVAVFAAVIKSSLLLPVAEGIGQLKWLWFSRSKPLIDFEQFDLASRGPWGAFLLMFHVRSRHLAAFGALITVLALAIDPFTQQIIQPVLCHRKAPGIVAKIPRAHNFTGVGMEYGRIRTAAMGDGMSDAIAIGVLKNNSESITFHCSTGNCTFPTVPGSGETYQTVAVESGCVDISQEFRPLGESHWAIPQLSDNVTGIGAENVTRTQASPNIDKSFDKHWPEKTKSNHNLFIATVQTITLDRNCLASSTNLTVGNCQIPFAAECRMWPAVQTISARIALGKLEENVIASTPFQRNERYRTGLGNAGLLLSSRVLRDGKWEECRPTAEESSDNQIRLVDGITWASPENRDPADIRWYPRDCVWYAESYDLSATSWELWQMFNAKTLVLIPGPLWPSPGEGPHLARSLYRNGTASISTVEAYFAQLASSMSAYLRINPNRDQTLGYAYGDAIRTDTCIRVRWAWLSFPASLVAMAFAFLLLTIWRTHKQRHDHSASERGAWKSSSLAVLFSGLDGGAKREYGNVVKKSDMMDRAEEMRVSLMLAEDGWKLRSSESGRL